MHTVPQGRCCQHLEPHKERFIQVQHPTGAGGDPVYSHSMLRSPHSYTGTWVCNPIPPPPAGSLLEALPPWRQMGLYKHSGQGGPGGGPSHHHSAGRKSDVCPYTVSFCMGVHAEGLFMNSGKYLFWKIHTSKYINPPIKHTGSSGPTECLDTSACQSSTLISACCLQKKPAFWTVFSAESQSWRRQG